MTNATTRSEILAELAERFGGMMTLTDIAWAIGTTTAPPAMSFVEGLPSYTINGRRRWRTSDIATRLVSLREEAEDGAD